VTTCFIVPHFNHARQFGRMLPQLLAHGLPVILVDDHSSEAEFEKLEKALQASRPAVTVIRHKENRGKGAAVQTGLDAAWKAGHTHAFQIDADGQHDLNDVSRLLNQSEMHPAAIICGEPQFDRSIPSFRYYARYLTLGLCRIECLGPQIRDAMCGLRIYPLESIVPLCQGARLGDRMDFDPEVLVRAVWKDIELRFVPVDVIYPEDGKSHFRYVRDNICISWMHTRLIAGMLIRSPTLLKRQWRRS
jgi:glycosyltransferase involved in cell wall biosynthesis